jgi:hypothetical protein
LFPAPLILQFTLGGVDVATTGISRSVSRSGRCSRDPELMKAMINPLNKQTRVISLKAVFCFVQLFLIYYERMKTNENKAPLILNLYELLASKLSIF